MAKRATMVGSREPETRLGTYLEARGAAFYDASAIAKAYLNQAQTAQVRRSLGEDEVIVSRLSQVEVPSAIARRCREGLVSKPDGDLAIAKFLEDMNRWAVVEVTDEVARRAVALLSVHRIRAGDAIQVASALVARDRAGPVVSRFVADDARLLATARLEGLLIQEYLSYAAGGATLAALRDDRRSGGHAAVDRV